MGIIKQAQIIAQIENEIKQLRPYINEHGGDIQFISYIDGTVSIKLQGACVGCPMSFFTLKMGIEERLKENISEIKQVVSID